MKTNLFFIHFAISIFSILIFSIVTEEDADRVWSCVENAVRVMAEAEEE